MKIKKITHVISPNTQKFYDVINSLPYNNFAVRAGDRNIVSHNCAFMD